ncbi:MAG TPA: hypothetical protein DD723_02815 [Candidatus Omnitrophica bacterium]|nr:MAG: hypothetical protein A2Z81_01465 [Omnitrophica WOR_2 bacterium GWA2_45_18]HBR14459.1 hypothetical protein [Candidatus Omnitrophota bacterium]
MAGIKPFKAVYYNSKKIKDLSKVVCPPYDVISPEEQEYYHNLSPQNFIHIDLAKDKPSDNKTNNKYIRARRIYEDWLKKGVLMQDEAPCIYFYKQEYKIQGQNYSRLGFISLMELEDEKDSKIVPHENTHAHAVEDRLNLCKSLHSNLSCIFVCFSDKQKKVEKNFNKHVMTNNPLFDIEDNDKVRHKLWRVDDPILINEINASLSDQHLFIADGHHRYKVAMEYRRFKMGRKKTLTGNEPFNYVMTYFTNMDSRDLLILPMHRIVKQIPKDLDFLEEFFRIDRVKSRDDLHILLARAGHNEHALGFYTRDGAKLLRLKNKQLIDEHVKEGSSEYKRLDATILKYFVFDRVGIESSSVIYTKDMKEAFSMVDNFEAEASFILNPVKITQLKTIALNGEKMPPKTTYFYPKVLSGLTVYKMD